MNELQLEMERHRKTWRQLEQVNNAMRRIIERCEVFIDDEAEMSTASVEVLMGIAEDALSQQAEPLEPAPAQDELRKRFDQIEREIMEGKHTAASVFTQMRTAAMYIRPAQTDQQVEAEEWRSVDGYEGLYSVSSLGRLRSDRTGKYLSLNSRVASGYVKADMHKDGEKKQTTVHRLVAQAFLERPEGADEVNHINGDKLDNRVSNLAWCSRRENVNHGYYELGHLVHRVKAIPIEGNGPELVFASIEQAVANGFHSGGIYTCLGQPHRYHLGYYWRSLKDAAPIAQPSQQPEQSNLEPLLNAGAALSNMAYNLAQRPGVTLDQIVCDTLSSARKSWDAARAAMDAKEE